MKAALLTHDGFELKDVPVPKCEPGQLLVKTAVCGICEGDVYAYRSARSPAAAGERLLGHEGNGTVCEFGAGVQGFKIGDRVACLGGAYAEYFVSPPELLAKIPDALSFEVALGEPVACYVHAAGRFGIQAGDRVAVLGCGFMGLGCIQMAKLAGPSEIHAFDPIEWRRSKALELGASQVDDPQSCARDLTSMSENYDVVIEAAGVQDTLDVATVLVKQHGKIIIVGAHHSNQGQRNINMYSWNYKAIDVINGHVRRDNEKLQAMKEGLNHVAERNLDIKAIEEIYRFRMIQNAFEDLIARKPGLFKAVLTFSSAE